MRVRADPSTENDDDRSVDTVRRPDIGGRCRVVTRSYGTLFEGTDDQYYTGWQVGQRLRSDTWALCLRQRSPPRLLVETEDEALLMLTPTEPDELPAGIEIRVSDSRAHVVDTRRIPQERPIDRYRSPDGTDT